MRCRGMARSAVAALLLALECVAHAQNFPLDLQKPQVVWPWHLTACWRFRETAVLCTKVLLLAPLLQACHIAVPCSSISQHCLGQEASC